MESMMRPLALSAAVIGIGAILATAPASATERKPFGSDMVGLTGHRTLVFVDGRGKLVRKLDIRNIGSRVVGIDVRPANRRLYALLANGQLVTVELPTGRAAFRSRLSVPVPKGKVSIDFNPSVDRLRIVSSDGTNLRTNVDDGSTIVDTRITFAMPNPFGGTMPAVTGVAYTNSRPGTVPATTLRAIDDMTDALYQVQPANAGVLVPIGALRADVGPRLGFDIATDRRGRNVGIVVSGRTIAEIDLAGGALLSSSTLHGRGIDLRDVAALIR
jgi:hypothetical protein